MSISEFFFGKKRGDRRGKARRQQVLALGDKLFLRDDA